MPSALLTAAIVLVLASPAPQSAGSGSVRGRVTDAATGDPIARAVVKLGFLGPGTQMWEASTGDDGGFVFPRVPAGGYKLFAEPPPGVTTHVSRAYGQSVRFDPNRHDMALFPIRLSDGDELVAEIGLPPALTVSGRVLDASGLPSRNTSILVRNLNGSVAARSERPTDAEGRFTVDGLRADDYDVCAVPSLGGALLRAQERLDGERPLETCHPADVTSRSSGNLPVLEITLRYGPASSATAASADPTTNAPPVSVVGRIEFAEGVPSSWPIVNVNTAGRRIGSGVNLSRVGGDSRFYLDGLIGPQMFQVFGAMKPWVVKSIRYRGEEIYGRSIQLRSSTNPDDLVVVLTNRSASVTAKLRGPADQSKANAAVVLISLDTATGAPLDNAAVRPIGAEGPFGLPLVRPGDYLIAAVAPEDVSEPQASVARRVAPVAQRITLAAGEHRTIELDLVRASRGPR
jgi:Carboxypeptidase regulatory-like domain